MTSQRPEQPGGPAAEELVKLVDALAGRARSALGATAPPRAEPEPCRACPVCRAMAAVRDQQRKAELLAQASTAAASAAAALQVGVENAARTLSGLLDELREPQQGRSEGPRSGADDEGAPWH